MFRDTQTQGQDGNQAGGGFRSHLDKTLVGGQTDSDVVLEGPPVLGHQRHQLVHQLQHIKLLIQSRLSAVEAAEGWRLLAYLRKEQLLLWSALQDHGDLSQVGAAPAEEALLGAAGCSKQGRPTSTRLHPALDLQAFKSNPDTQISLTHTHTHKQGVCSPAERVQM